MIQPGVMDLKMFTPNIYSKSLGIIATDIIRFVIIFIMMFFMAVEIHENRKKYSDFTDALNSSIFVTLFIFILYTVSFVIKLTYCYNDEAAFYIANGSTYVDTYSVANYYNVVFFIESLLFSAVSIKLLGFLKFIDYIKLFYSSMENGLIIFFKYSIFFLSILLGYACIAHILWGPYISDFSTFQNSFLNILLFTIGKKNLF